LLSPPSPPVPPVYPSQQLRPPDCEPDRPQVPAIDHSAPPPNGIRWKCSAHQHSRPLSPSRNFCARCSKATADALWRNPTTGIAGCCARVISGHEAADPAITFMKSRRRIAFTKAGTTPNRTRLQQGFPIGGMGSDRHFAWQQSSGCNVGFGSKADIGWPLINVRFTPPKSGHQSRDE
jgi:hypothetical protein